MTKPSVLWIAPRSPFPPQSGAERATYNLVKGLADESMDVDYLYLKPRGEPFDSEAVRRELGFRKVFVIEREHSKVANMILAPFEPMTYAPFCAPNVLRAFGEIADSNRWDGFVFDGLHAAALFSRGGSYRSPAMAKFAVHRAHNVESMLWEREAERSNGVRKLAVLFQEKMVKRFETSVLRSVAVNHSISWEDLDLYRSMEPRAKHEFLPLGFDVESQSPPGFDPSGSGLKLLYVGRLDWAPNRSGLEWLLREVWPEAHARRPELELTIIGSGDASWLREFATRPGLRILGRVADLGPEYARADATVIPVYYGSGVRVKALESFFYGRSCLSTSIGVGGIGADERHHYVRVESSNDWVEALTRLSDEDLRGRGRACFQLMRDSYDARKITARLRETLKRLATGQTWNRND